MNKEIDERERDGEQKTRRLAHRLKPLGTTVFLKSQKQQPTK
jgi:hypothetical protein